MSNIEIEKQISKVENELSKEFSQYSERKLQFIMLETCLRLNTMD